MGNKYDLAIKYINTESCGKTVRGSGAGGGGVGGGGWEEGNLMQLQTANICLVYIDFLICEASQ